MRVRSTNNIHPKFLQNYETFFSRDRIYLPGEMSVPRFARRVKSSARLPKGKNSNAGSGERSLRIAAVQEGPRIYGNSRFNIVAWHWRDNFNLYAGARGVAEVATGGQARAACARGQ